MAAEELGPPPKKADNRFDNWVFLLWKAIRLPDLGVIGGTPPILTSAGTGTLNISHSTSGVAAGTYGGTSGLPRFTVDTFGHVTAGANFPLQATTPILVGSNAGTYTWGHSTSGVTLGTYGSASVVPQVVVNTWGHVTAVNTLNIAIGGTAVTGADLTVSAPLTGTATNALLRAGTIGHGTSGVASGTYGSASILAQFAINTYGHVTSVTTFALAGSNAAGSDLTISSPLVGTVTNALLRAGTIAHGTSGVVTGTYGGANSIPQIVVNTFGHVTAVSTFAAGGFTLGTRVVTTSGTQALFSGIAAGAKKVEVSFDQVSLSGTGHFLVQIGDAGGIETNAYVSGGFLSGLVATSTSGYLVYMNAAAGTFAGRMDLSLQNSAAFTWVASISGYYPSGGASGAGAGVKSLSAELTQLRVIPSGTDTFDGGSINILYGV